MDPFWAWPAEEAEAENIVNLTPSWTTSDNWILPAKHAIQNPKVTWCSCMRSTSNLHSQIWLSSRSVRRIKNRGQSGPRTYLLLDTIFWQFFPTSALRGMHHLTFSHLKPRIPSPVQRELNLLELEAHSSWTSTHHSSIRTSLQYLCDKIREFCRPEYWDLVCLCPIQAEHTTPPAPKRGVQTKLGFLHEYFKFFKINF